MYLQTGPQRFTNTFRPYNREAECRATMARKYRDLPSKFAEVGFLFRAELLQNGVSIRVGVSPADHEDYLAALQKIQRVCFPEWEPQYEARFEGGLCWFTFTRD